MFLDWIILSTLLSYGFLIADPCFAAILSIFRLSSCVFLQNAFLDTLLVRMCRIFGRVEKLLIFPILWTSILSSISLFCWRIYTDRIIMVSTKVTDLLGMLVMRTITLYIYTDIGQVVFGRCPAVTGYWPGGHFTTLVCMTPRSHLITPVFWYLAVTILHLGAKMTPLNLH